MAENHFLKSDSVISTLTLRYDISLKPKLPKKTWKDFLPTNNSPDLNYIEKLLEEDINKKLNSLDIKKISIALSGGIDSTLILSLIRKNFPSLEIDAISIKFAESIDETVDAAKIAENFGANHHIVYLENYLSELPKAISIIKLPFWDLHWYYVAKKAKTLSKILASGDGGDEIFSGYTFRYEKFLSITQPNSTPLEKVHAYLSCHERDHVSDQDFIFGKLTNFSWKKIYQILLPYFDNSLPRLDQVFLADYNGKLMYNFNQINTRIADKLNIKILAPLLNENIITYGLHIDNKFKYDSITNVGKLPLRKLLEKNKAHTLISNQKLGFNVNTVNLWKTFGYKICKNYLDESRIGKENWINQNWIKKYIDSDCLNINYINKFLGLLALEIWYRLFITKEIKPDTVLE